MDSIAAGMESTGASMDSIGAVLESLIHRSLELRNDLYRGSSVEASLTPSSADSSKRFVHATPRRYTAIPLQSRKETCATNVPIHCPEKGFTEGPTTLIASSSDPLE